MFAIKGADIIKFVEANNCTRKITLRISVDDHDALASVSKRPPEVKRGRSFADAALVIEKRN